MKLKKARAMLMIMAKKRIPTIGAMIELCPGTRIVTAMFVTNPAAFGEATFSTISMMKAAIPAQRFAAGPAMEIKIWSLRGFLRWSELIGTGLAHPISGT